MLLILAGPATGEGQSFEIGGDRFLTQNAPAVDADRDVFAIGVSTALSGTVVGDAHAVGLSVEVDAASEGDLYATGVSVAIRGSVGSDLTAAGATVRTHRTSTTGANARLSGGSVTIDGPIEGALVATGGEVFLNARVGGDAFLSGARVRFGPNAVVAGQLTYATRERMDVPESVAEPARVRFERIEFPNPGRRDGDWSWAKRPEMEIGFGAILAALATTIGSFMLVGAVFLAFSPALVSKLRKTILASPGQTALSGLIGLSVIIGSVPILALTIVGIPLVPIAALTVALVWFLGYVLGAYALGMGIARNLGMAEDPSIWVRLLVLAATAFVAALLNFIPILGWMANLVIVLLGVGALAILFFEWILPRLALNGKA